MRHLSTKQRTILFLIADTGAGHRSAANAISGAIKLIAQKEQDEWHARHPITPLAMEEVILPILSAEQPLAQDDDAADPPPIDYRIEIVDVFEEYSRFPLREAVKLYGPTIRYNPRLFGEVFHRSNREGTVMAVQSLASPLILNGLLRLFSSVQPDIIVSIHPMLNHVTVHALLELGLDIPFLTVVTDLISVHYAWFAPGVDGYIVPTEQAKELYLRRGLDANRVHMLGMPIDPKFTLPTENKASLQHKFGLKPGLPVVLLVGGGDGAGGLYTAVRAISHARIPVQLLVVTGRNRRLYAQLQRTRAGLHVPAKIFGFVQNMPELMRASDVIITKAGPGTICEALACNLPIILSGYVPGQEEGNVEFVISNDVGVFAHEPAVLVDALRRLIKPGSPELQRRLRNAQKLCRPYASFDIAHSILSYLPAREAESIWLSAQSQHRQRMMSGRVRSAIRLRRLHRPLPLSLNKSALMRQLGRLRTRGLASTLMGGSLDNEKS
ncbi:MAG TPA: glycosyltransferase [Ktedonobacteraceae bacterium]|nr:glycosyltransferase [Ktedonobacteraceae bacterium]